MARPLSVSQIYSAQGNHQTASLYSGTLPNIVDRSLPKRLNAAVYDAFMSRRRRNRGRGTSQHSLDASGPPPPYSEATSTDHFDQTSQVGGPPHTINSPHSSGVNDRSSNEATVAALEHLHPIYYCLYAGSDILPSLRPIARAHPGPTLSMLYIEHVPPPRTVYEVIHHICVRENLDFVQAQLYGKDGALSPANAADTTTGGHFQQIPWSQTISHESLSVGSRENPYLLVITRSQESSLDMARRETVGLFFTGSITSSEMQQKIRANLGSVPIPVESHEISDRTQPLVHETGVYYRLYWESRRVALPSIRPLHPSDPSLARTYLERMPPPRSPENCIDHIAALEGFHPSRIKLIKQNPEGETQFGAYSEIPRFVQLPWDGTGAGSSISSPFLVLVDAIPGADGEPDRRTLATPLWLPARLLKWFLWSTRPTPGLTQAPLRPNPEFAKEIGPKEAVFGLALMFLTVLMALGVILLFFKYVTQPDFFGLSPWWKTYIGLLIGTILLSVKKPLAWTIIVMASWCLKVISVVLWIFGFRSLKWYSATFTIVTSIVIVICSASPPLRANMLYILMMQVVYFWLAADFTTLINGLVSKSSPT